MALIKLTAKGLASTIREEPAPVAAPALPQVAAPAPAQQATDIDALLGLSPLQADAYGPELLAALAALHTHVAAEGVTIDQLKTACLDVNAILLANPSLATEVMLPEHLGLLCQAAYKLSGLTTSPRVAKKPKTKAAAEHAATDATTSALARLQALQNKSKGKRAPANRLLTGAHKSALATLQAAPPAEEEEF